MCRWLEDMLMKDRKWFSRGNILNGVFFAVLLMVLFVPAAKAIMIRGLMAVGLFQPDVSAAVAQPARASEVAFRDINGKVINLSSLKGKVVFINFWATWCPPCRAELPAINDLYQKLSNNPGIVFLITDADNKLDRSVPFVQKYHYTFPVVGLNGPAPASMLGGLIPATLVIDKQGAIVFKHEGMADYSSKKFVQFLQNLAE